MVHSQSLPRAWFTACLLCLLVGMLPAVALSAERLCGFPGRDGELRLSGQINRFMASASNTSVDRGSRWLPLAMAPEGLASGDLVLLIQMQGATIHAGNSLRYGDGEAGDARAAGWQSLQAGQYEFLRVDAVDGNRVRVRGDGPGAGTRFSYRSTEPDSATAQGRARWQLVSVPQAENVRLEGDLFAPAWNGFDGGLVVLDVRDTLDMAGHRVSAAGRGFRGGAALTLDGALGEPADLRYRAPASDALAVRFGHHASKGEGLAGTPRWLLFNGDRRDTLPGNDDKRSSDGYPHGSMARGAPANAGGGGNSLALDNSRHSGGGGGGGGAAGETGRDPQGHPAGGQGGAAVPVSTPRLVAGGGGGAGSRSHGEGVDGSGGAGGGIVVLRAGRIINAGGVDVSGSAGLDGPQAGGGGGGAGTAMVLGAFQEGRPVTFAAAGGDGGAGKAAGGAGGDGRVLLGGGLEAPSTAAPYNPLLPVARLPGVLPGYLCRPNGMLVSGVVLVDSGAGADGVAHDGLRQRGERGLADVPVVIRRPGGAEVTRTRTSGEGMFALSLDQRLAGEDLVLEVALPDGWWPVIGRAEDLPLARFEYQGDGRWRFTAQEEYLQDGVVLSVVAQPALVSPPARTIEPGTTQLFLFTYQAGTHGQVRLRYRGELSGGAGWKHSFFLDQDCDGGSEYVDHGETRWIDFRPGVPVCVRVRVEVPVDARAGRLNMQVETQTRLSVDDGLVAQPSPDAAIGLQLSR
ncbi:MAG: hypothetical protein P1U64_06910 [Alcanivoracaceae bacterium]|nr:hypothetical protein [Alcanivoracaceae bacterium]